MTQDAFMAALQERVGAGYAVSAHPKRRSEPQFDIHHEPREHDSEGNPYRVTFSMRSDTLAALTGDEPIIQEYAEASVANLAIQKVKGRAAPEWRE